MKRIKKITFVVFLFLLLSVGVFICNALNDEKSPPENCSTIVIQLKSSERIDFSSVILDVYSAELDKSVSKEGMLQYNETLAFSLNFNENGVLRFVKPTECFSVSINLESLPSNYGVDMHTRFFHADDTSYSFKIEKVDSVGIECVQGSFVHTLKDKNGIVMYASAQIKEQNAYSYSFDSTLNKITVTDKYVVNFSGKSYTFFEDREIKYSNEVEKLKIMYSMEIISQDKYIEGIIEYLLNPINKINPDKINKLKLVEEIKDYIADKKSSSSANLNNIINEIEAITFAESRQLDSYVASNSGHFNIHYDPQDISEEVALAVENEFDSIDHLFCTTMGFNRPFSNSSSSIYNVYILPDAVVEANAGDAAAYTTSLGTGGYSEITISFTIARGVLNGSANINYPDAEKGVLAHEYMHAIMFSYGVTSNTQKTNWLHESIASWAGGRYITDYYTLISNSVNKFLKTAWKPIYYYDQTETYKNRHYGSLLFPMYIDQQTSGYNVIKRILMCYSDSNDPLTAVSAGLQYYGYNLSSVFARCAAFNSYPKYFYNGLPASVTPPQDKRLAHILIPLPHLHLLMIWRVIT